MTRRRFIADEVSGDSAILLGEHADHLVRVLRVRPGQEFDIATGGAVRRGIIIAAKNSRVEFDLHEEVPSVNVAEITLLLAIFRFDRMEWAIEKCTELGVSKIVPIIARRTGSHLAAAAVKRLERWQKITRQASEQSRRAIPPELAPPVKLSQALDLPAGLRIVLSESENQKLLRDVLTADASNHGVALAIGPEGGWTDDELDLCQKYGWISASLGATILRAETAAMAATAIVASTLSSL